MPYKVYIADMMLKGPRSLENCVEEQFSTLIVEPFAKQQLQNGLETLVVALDGLDECGSDLAEQDPHQTCSRGRAGGYVQCEVVRMLSSSVPVYPSVPPFWIIASRPEEYLQAVFYDKDIRPSFWEEHIPVDSDEACQDVDKFLHNELIRIRKKYPHDIPGVTWPSSKEF